MTYPYHPPVADGGTSNCEIAAELLRTKMQRAALEADIVRLTERKRALAAGIAALRGVEQDLLLKVQGSISDVLPPGFGLLRWSAKRRSSWAPALENPAAVMVAINPPSQDETEGFASSAAAAALPPPLANGTPRRRSMDAHSTATSISAASSAMRGVLYQLLDLDASSREHSQALFSTSRAAAGSFAAAVAASGPPAPAAACDSPAPVPATPTVTAEVAPVALLAPRRGRAAAAAHRSSFDSESGAFSAAVVPATEPDSRQNGAAAAVPLPLRGGRRRRRHGVDPAAFRALLRHHAVCSGDSGRVAAPVVLDAGTTAASPHGTSWGMGLMFLADL